MTALNGFISCFCVCLFVLLHLLRFGKFSMTKMRVLTKIMSFFFSFAVNIEKASAQFAFIKTEIHNSFAH